MSKRNMKGTMFASQGDVRSLSVDKAPIVFSKDDIYINTIQPRQAALSLKAMRRGSKHSSGVTTPDFKGVTYSNQDRLPRLPIPSLEDTLAKFPSRVEALLDEKEFAEAKQIIQEFMENEGPVLQQKLIDYEREGYESEKIGSYIEEFWNESYLSPDVSTVLNLNPFFILEDGPDPKIASSQLRRAARLCFNSIKFASSLRNETLEPDVVKGQPLCMDQFKVIFGSSRQPVIRLDTNQDDVHVYNDSSHVVVLYKNQFYYFPALWPESGIVAVDETDVLDILRAVVRHADANVSQAEASRTAVGVLTSLPRSEWAKARRELCESSETNKLALKVIDSALFVLVLDDFAPRDIHSAAANALHGTNQLLENDTLQVGSCLNRWYDKLQIIVCSNGASQVNFEHATIDGHTALRFVSDVFAETVISFAESIVDVIHGRGRIAHVIEAEVVRVANCKERGFDVLPKKLVFEFPKSTIERIYFAESAICDNVGASDTCVLEFVDYGKNLIVANKMSPDAYVQMSILIAYYKLYGKVVCMYEPAMTKSFYHGRTEAIRGATVQARELCRFWCNDKASKSDKLEALRLATIEHSRLTRESSAGQGTDRHLYALKCLASRLGMQTPKFFESSAWKTLNHTVLSTSNCGNPSLRLFGFGPVVPDGFGVGYIIKDLGISYSVSSKHRQTQRFVGSLRTALKEMEALLTRRTAMTVLQRTPLVVTEKAKKDNQELHADSYGDMWGQHVAPSPTSEPNPIVDHRHFRRQSSGSKFFAQVRTRSQSIALLGIEQIRQDVDLNDLSETENSSDGYWYSK